MNGSSDHWGDAMHDFHGRDTEDDFDADRRWAAEVARRRTRTIPDERRGRDANLAGKPFSLAENIDWQRGWQNTQDDRGLDDEP